MSEIRYTLIDQDEFGAYTSDELFERSYDTFSEASDEVREMLNDLFPPVVIGRLEYPAGDVLAEVDSVAFHQECLDAIHEWVPPDEQE